MKVLWKHYKQKTRVENGDCLLKKVEYLSSSKGNITTKNKAQVIYELREKFTVSKLFKIAGIKRSKYYYWIKNLEQA